MLVLVGQRWFRWIAIGAMPFILNGIVLSGSRGAFLALVCGGLMLVVFKPSTHRKSFYALGVLALMLFAVLGQSYYWERLGSIKAAASEDEDTMDSSAASRFVIVNAQLRMAAAYPWGTGHRGTAVLSPQYIEDRYLTTSPNDPTGQRRRSSHNTFMTALVEQGIPGAVMYVWLLWWCFRTLRQQRRLARTEEWPPEQRAQLAAIAATLMVVFVAGQFVDYLKIEVQIWFFAILAARVAVFSPHPVLEGRAKMPAPALQQAAGPAGLTRRALR
jgi:O-antigen ligase